ncbi:MAG: hypothetical protein KDE31_30915, partial [Caldilineaceae bacterium]|nr:hypothetical protein [Caldilineaceae bacterium]
LDSIAPWALLALAQLHQQDRPTAEPFLAAAREIAPNQAYVDIVEAQLCTAWKAHDCAAAAYQRALEKRPDSGWLYGRIGDFYRPTDPPLPHQDWVKAGNYYREAVIRRPNDPWAQERLAFALFYQGDYVEAADHLALSLHELSHPQSQLAARYCTLAQMQQAAMLLDDALKNAQTCLAKLDNADMRSAVEALISQIKDAAETSQQ